jgi:hypothetical protein
MEVLVDENKRLSEELERLKENVLVTSLNDMKITYAALESENKILKKQSVTRLEKEELQKRLVMMKEIVDILKENLNTLAVSTKLFYRITLEKIEEPDELVFEDFEHYFSSCDLALADSQCFLSHMLPKRLECAEGKCRKERCGNEWCRLSG